MARFDPDVGRFVEPVPGDVSARVPGADFIMQLVPDRLGSVWVGTLEGGLARLDPATGRVSPLVGGLDPSGDWPDRVEAITISDDGVLWFEACAASTKVASRPGSSRRRRTGGPVSSRESRARRMRMYWCWTRAPSTTPATARRSGG